MYISACTSGIYKVLSAPWNLEHITECCNGNSSSGKFNRCINISCISYTYRTARPAEKLDIIGKNSSNSVSSYGHRVTAAHFHYPGFYTPRLKQETISSNKFSYCMGSSAVSKSVYVLHND